MNADMDDILGSRDVFTIAMHIAVKHQLPRPDYPELVKKIRGKYPQPIVLTNDNGRLWVDKHYVAFQLCSQADVRYEYVTAFHIAEESASYRAAAKARDSREEQLMATRISTVTHRPRMPICSRMVL